MASAKEVFGACAWPSHEWYGCVCIHILSYIYIYIHDCDIRAVLRRIFAIGCLASSS